MNHTEMLWQADEYFLREAPQRRLLQLRKDELVRLYDLAGLLEDAETFTKNEIATAIVAHRETSRASSPPPDVPATSEDEEVKPRRPIIPLRRRATDNSILPKTPAPIKHNLRTLRDRSFSLSTLMTLPRKGRSTSSISSTDSAEIITPQTPIRLLPRRGKQKSVEFSDDVSIEDSVEIDDSDEEKENERGHRLAPSPRRLRARDTNRRVTPMRKAKKKMGSLVEDEEDADDGGDEEEHESSATDEDDEEQNDAETTSDSELVTPRNRKRSTRASPVTRSQELEVTPIVRRLRPRAGRSSPPAPEKDESEDVNSDDSEEEEEEEEEEEATEEDAGDEEEEEVEDIIEPKRLRNGKIVGEEPAEEASEEEVSNEEEAADEDTEAIESDSQQDEEDQLDDDDEEMEDLGMFTFYISIPFSDYAQVSI